MTTNYRTHALPPDCGPFERRNFAECALHALIQNDPTLTGNAMDEALGKAYRIGVEMMRRMEETGDLTLDRIWCARNALTATIAGTQPSTSTDWIVSHARHLADQILRAKRAHPDWRRMEADAVQASVQAAERRALMAAAATAPTH